MEFILKLLEGKKTYLGLIMLVTPTIAAWLGYDVNIQSVQDLGPLVVLVLENISSILETGGLLLAAIGRAVTKAQ